MSNQVCETKRKRPIDESEAFFLHCALIPKRHILDVN